MKRPGPAVEKSVPPDESVQPSFQLYFGVPTELLARDMPPEPAATPEYTNQAELWVLPDLGPIACKGSETEGVKKRSSPLISTAISVPERLRSHTPGRSDASNSRWPQKVKALT